MRSDRPQNRAGREVAEDAKRAVRRTFDYLDLKPYQARMMMAQDRKARFILGGATPWGWPYDIPALSVEFWVAMNGDVTPVKVSCDASDNDPITSMAMSVLAVDVSNPALHSNAIRMKRQGDVVAFVEYDRLLCSRNLLYPRPGRP
jgi:hypothetical protein